MRQTRLHGLWVALAAVSMLFACSEECDVAQMSQRLAGPGAVACDGGIPCALEAMDGGLPFWLVLQRQGIDSQVGSGYARAANGALFQIDYDLAPQLGLNSATRFKCRELLAVPDDGGVPVDLACESPHGDTTVCQ
jgi:hypothetical protein